MVESELPHDLHPAEKGAGIRVLWQRRECAGENEPLLQLRGKPRPEYRRVGHQVLQPSVVGSDQAVQQRVHFAEERPAGERERREQDDRDRDREYRRAAALAHAARQSGAEGDVERPACNGDAARCQQGLGEAMHDPESQYDDRGGE